MASLVLDPAKRKFTLTCTVGVFICYCSSAYMQEKIFLVPGFTFGFYLTFVEFVVNALSALLIHQLNEYWPNSPFNFAEAALKEQRAQRKSDTVSDVVVRNNSEPFAYYFLLAISAVISMSCSNSSLRFVSYPTKIVVKASKVVLIMLVGLVVINKRYSIFEYILAVSTMCGLILFTLGDFSIPGNDSIPSFGWNTMTGVAMLFTSILAEAFMVNFQKKMFINKVSSPLEMTLYISAFGSIILFFGISMVTSEFQEALTFMSDGHMECHLYALAFSLFGFGGMVGVLSLLTHTDPLFVGLIVTARKALTLVFSFLIFPKPITLQHIAGSVMVFGSLFVHVYLSHRRAPTLLHNLNNAHNNNHIVNNKKDEDNNHNHNSNNTITHNVHDNIHHTYIHVEEEEEILSKEEQKGPIIAHTFSGV